MGEIDKATSRMTTGAIVFVSAISVFLYFELMTQVWFLNILNGYVIRVWIPPLALFLLVLVKKIRDKEKLFKPDFLNLLLLFYSLFGIISMLCNETLHNAIKYNLIMIAPVFYYIFIIEYFKNNDDIELILRVLFFSSIFICLHGIYLRVIADISPISVTKSIATNYGTSVQLSEAFYSEMQNGKWVVSSRGLRSYEAGKLGAMMIAPILFGIFNYVKSSKKSRYFYLVGSFALIIFIFESMSRSGIIALCAGLIVFFILLYKNEKKQRKNIVVIGFVILVGAIFYSVFLKPQVMRRCLQLLNFLDIDIINNYLEKYGMKNFGGGVSKTTFLDPHLKSIIAIPKHIMGDAAAAGGKFMFLMRLFLGSGYITAEHVLREHNRYFFIILSAGILTFIPYILFLFRLTFIIKKTTSEVVSKVSAGMNLGHFFFACSIAFLLKLMNEGMETFYYWIIFSLASAWCYNISKQIKAEVATRQNSK